MSSDPDVRLEHVVLTLIVFHPAVVEKDGTAQNSEFDSEGAEVATIAISGTPGLGCLAPWQNNRTQGRDSTTCSTARISVCASNQL